MTTYHSVHDVPGGELLSLAAAQEFNATAARVLCERCHRELPGSNGDLGSVTQTGQECVRCGGVSAAGMAEHLAHARDALVDARLAGATDADVAEVLRAVRYHIVLERWQRGDGSPPSTAQGL